MSNVEIRDARPEDISHLAAIWFDGWQDAHAEILPAELKRIRTLASFSARLTDLAGQVRVAGPPSAPVGFAIVAADELYQLYVSADARGTGIAAALVDDAESRLVGSGVDKAWLACAIGNERAARFYEKCGWQRTGTMLSQLDTPDGPFPLEVWRYEKALAGAGHT